MRLKGLFCLVLAFCLMMCGCGSAAKTQSESTEDTYMVGMWLSYLELDRMLEQNFKESFKKAVENCSSLGVTDLFVHVRPFCDSLYPSKYFPMRQSAEHIDYDILKYMTEITHAAKMRIHAWINPYRVKTKDENIDSLDEASIVKKWLTDEDKTNDKNICFYNGIYLNPTSNDAQKLVIDGIREILEKYNVDGIHFDDYFYPTDTEIFDATQYAEYVAECEQPLSREEWRRANVSQLISGVYTAVKFFDKNLVFSISPAASISKNYEQLFADVELWMKNGIVDLIIPQLYFGFEYPQAEFCFDNLIEEWNSLKRAKNVNMAIGLGAYKLNQAEIIDSEEWCSTPDIMAKQTRLCRETKGINGHIYYSYTSLFGGLNDNALNHLLKSEVKYIEKNKSDNEKNNPINK